MRTDAVPPGGSFTAFSDSTFQTARALGRSRAGDLDEPFVGGNQVVVVEGLHHVLGRDGGAADLPPGDDGAAFECERPWRLRAGRAR